MLSLLKENKPKKLFIAGEKDIMRPIEILREDESRGGFDFKSVNNASHFVTFDQAEIVAGLIEFFCDKIIEGGIQMKGIFKMLFVVLALSALVQTIALAKVKTGDTTDSSKGHSDPTV